jgi:hypothetical protein
VIDPGFHFVRAIAVDTTDVVWVDNNGIWRAPKDGSGSGTQLTNQTFASNSIAIVGTNVYCASPSGGLYVVPKAGGTPALVTGSADFETLATDGVNAYTVALGIGGAFSLPLAGGTPTRLPTVANDPFASAECFSSYALDGTNLYVGCIVGMTQNRVFVVPTSGAASTSWASVFYPVTTNSTLIIGELTTTGTKVDVQFVDKATMGAPTTIIPNAQVSDLHVDEVNVWYLDGFTGQGELYRAPLVANATPTSLAGPGLYSEAFAMDATYLYFGDASGRIVRISQ